MSVASLSSYDDHKCLQTLLNVPRRAKLSPVAIPWARGIHLGVIGIYLSVGEISEEEENGMPREEDLGPSTEEHRHFMAR